jgi:hypothetical protein
MSKNQLCNQTLLEKGVVLAINCVPKEIDPNILQFWTIVANRFKERGVHFILASTTRTSSANIKTVDVLFNLPDFARRYPGHFDPIQPPPASAQIIQLMNWYSCSYEDALKSLNIAQQYYDQLIESLCPAAVIGWQSMNPCTRLLFQAANSRDIPVWSGERGWIADTLMFDLGQNNFLSEIHRSFAIDRLFERYKFDAKIYAQLETRKLAKERVGRYSSEIFVKEDDFRARLSIPTDAKIIAFFMHGEPAMHLNLFSVLNELHRTSKVTLQRQLDEISKYCIDHGYYLLIQHHPFNRDRGYTLDLADSIYIKEVSVNFHTLLNASDRCLFTFSTIQYDAVLQHKPFGLLSRSSLNVSNAAYVEEEFCSFNDFMDALVDALDWEIRLKNLQRFLLFIYENFLLDISPAYIVESANRFAAQIAKFERHIDRNIASRIEEFLGKWA